VPRKLGHARFVTENRAAADATRGIDGEHRDAMAALAQAQAERLDKGRFADPRHAGDAHAVRLSSLRQKRREHLLGALFVGGMIAFDQRDRASQERAIAGHDALDIVAGGELRSFASSSCRCRVFVWLVGAGRSASDHATGKRRLGVLRRPLGQSLFGRAVFVVGALEPVCFAVAVFLSMGHESPFEERESSASCLARASDCVTDSGSTSAVQSTR
jgi:hypothetical protein